MKRTLIYTITLYTLLMGALCSCFAASPGTTGGQFLKIAPGARPAAMGDAYVAIAGDANAVYYNPAGLIKIEDLNVTVMQSTWLQDVSYQFLGIGKKLGKTKALGASIIILDSGDINSYDSDGSALADYKMTDMMIGLSYAANFDKISVGMSLKNIQETIAENRASCVSFDIGMISVLKENVSLGVSAQNVVATELNYNTQNHKLPLIIRAGAGIRFTSSILFAFELDLVDNNRLSAHSGIEYAIKDSMAIRMGYKTSAASLGGISGLSAGIGLLLNNFSVEYTFAPYGILGDTHRISVNLEF